MEGRKETRGEKGWREKGGEEGKEGSCLTSLQTYRVLQIDRQIDR